MNRQEKPHQRPRPHKTPNSTSSPHLRKIEPGSLRIGKAAPPMRTGAGAGGVALEAAIHEPEPPPEKPYLARLVLLMPAEVISL